MVPALEEAADFFQSRGLSVNAKKSTSVAATTVQGKSVPRSRPVFRLRGSLIPIVSTLNSFKYLGHHFSATGLGKPSLHNLCEWVKNLGRAALKPDQKLQLLRNYLVPRLLHGLQTPRITAGVLRECDKVIKHAVKAWLHLPIHTADALIHAKIRDGGLGIPSLRVSIPRIFHSRLQNLLTRGDSTIQSLLRTEHATKMMCRLEGLVTTYNPPHFWRQHVASSAMSSGIEHCTDDRASRSWLEERPPGWTGHDFVRAVQLRTNTLPTVGIPSNPPNARKCRAGCARVESLSHVLQSCPVTHGMRIGRHDNVVKHIANHCRRKSWRTEVEPHVRHADGQLFKPDIVVHQPDRTIVCDVQVSWEGSTPLEIAWERKRVVYDCIKFREAASKQWPNVHLEFHPIIIGARGVWPRANKSACDTLQLPHQIKANCVNAVVKWASSIHRTFMSSIWR